MINNIITKALKTIERPVLYSSRGESVDFPLIVFNVIETPHLYADNESEFIEYSIILNLYAQKDLLFKYITEIKKIMKENGFIRKPQVSGMWDETLKVFNQPLEYKYYREDE